MTLLRTLQRSAVSPLRYSVRSHFQRPTLPLVIPRFASNMAPVPQVCTASCRVATVAATARAIGHCTLKERADAGGAL